MKLLIIGFFVFLFLLSPQKSHATIVPNLLSPSNNATVSDTSPKLSWSYSGQCTGSGSCFRIQVASSSAFASVYKDYYTNYTYYSPKLSLQQWFWRAKAKDSSSTWSDWSTVFSFTIVSTPAPTPTPTPSPTPFSSVQSSTPAPTDSVSPTPTESSSDLVLSDSTLSQTIEPKGTGLSVNLFDLKSTASSKSVLPASTKSTPLQSPKSSEEEFLADKGINPSKILIILGVIIILAGAGVFFKSIIK